jgi:hypothetical protein
LGHYRLQCAQEREARRTKVSAIWKRDLVKDCFSPARELQQHLPPIFATAHSFQEAMGFETIHELHGAMVLNLKTLREDSDSGLSGRWQPLDRQERLILLRLDSGRARGMFAQSLKAPDFVTEVGERAVIESSVC